MAKPAGYNRKKYSSKYKRDRQRRGKRILIVCEGQTEERYFKSFKVHGITVQIKDLGESKTQLVNHVTRMISYNKNTYDEVWCVFDMDKNLQNADSQESMVFDNAIQTAHKLGYKVAYSNDAFELWFYLHYDNVETPKNRTFYYKALGKRWNLKNYEKEAKEEKFCAKNYERLQNDENASQESAISRAKKLFLAQEDLKFHQQNPVTKIYKLVKVLNDNLRK